MDRWAIRAIAAGAAGTCGFMAWAVRGRSASVLAPSVWRGRRDRRALALTFDDGPSERTPEILEILDRHRVRATFFQCGANVDRLPEIARAVQQRGHEIGNHSYAHPQLYFRSPRFMEDDLRLAQDTIEAHTGTRPRWFRAPFGARWFGLGGVQRRLGVTGVMWTVIGYDWKAEADQVVRRVAQRVSNGGIICLHDGRQLLAKPDIGVTVEAVRRLVPLLLERGYRLETINNLICPKN